MTAALRTQEVVQKIKEHLPGAAVEASEGYILVGTESLFQVAEFLKTAPALEFDYLSWLTGVDFIDYIELVYQLVSLKHNHRLLLKARCPGREAPAAPSLVPLWRGADFQEREVYDLLGVSFSGHPNMKRMFLWEGFEGHPLRRDYL